MKVIQLKDAVSVIRNTLAEGGLADTLELRMGIKAKEFIEPKWIPVSEKIPDELGPYLVTKARLIKTSDNKLEIEYEVTVERVTLGCQWNRKNNSVIAWMPLPESYKEGATE